MIIADSNILIYATQPEYGGLRQWLLDCMESVYLTPASYELAIGLRQRRRLALVNPLATA
jgi:predicted nucleic acid-binding protein